MHYYIITYQVLVEPRSGTLVRILSKQATSIASFNTLLIAHYKYTFPAIAYMWYKRGCTYYIDVQSSNLRTCSGQCNSLISRYHIYTHKEALWIRKRIKRPLWGGPLPYITVPNIYTLFTSQGMQCRVITRSFIINDSCTYIDRCSTLQEMSSSSWVVHTLLCPCQICPPKRRNSGGYLQLLQVYYIMLQVFLQSTIILRWSYVQSGTMKKFKVVGWKSPKIPKGNERLEPQKGKEKQVACVVKA